MKDKTLRAAKMLADSSGDDQSLDDIIVGPDYGWKEHCQSYVIADDSWWVKDDFRIMV